MATWDRPEPNGSGRRRAPWWIRWTAFVMGAGAFSWALAAVARNDRPGGNTVQAEGTAASQPAPSPGAWWAPPAGYPAWEPARADGLTGVFEEQNDEHEEGLWEREDEDDYPWRGQSPPARTTRLPDARTRRS